MSHNYEVEIKSLLGEKQNADTLREKLRAKGLEEKSKHSQLNHYFKAPGDREALRRAVEDIITEEKKDSLARIISDGKDLSVRTRKADENVLLVIKASVGDDTSANGVRRIEFEAEVDMSIDELDQKLLDAGLEYQAKWSRDREEFVGEDMNVTIDRNAGYGYLAEFEKVTDDESKTEDLRSELLALMEELGVEELPQDRLERMFEFYNEHWPEFYGTDKVFDIK